MTRQDTDELLPGIAGGSNDGDIRDGGGGGDSWTCVTCPETAPMNGSTCDSEVNDECDYDMGVTCECGGDDMWDCGM